MRNVIAVLTIGLLLFSTFAILLPVETCNVSGETSNNKPTADAGGPYTGYVGEIIAFDGSKSSDPDTGDTLTYRWDIDGDGDYDTDWSTNSGTTYLYSKDGIYTVKLQVKDNSEATDTDNTSVVISMASQKPTANIVIPGGTKTYTFGIPIEFYGLGQPIESIVGYRWTSSREGILSGAQGFTRSNLSVGTHIIYFEVQNNNGEWSEKDSVTVIIESGGGSSNRNPIAVAGGPYNGYVNGTVILNATESYDPDGDIIVLYEWDFGDGNTGRGGIIEHTYASENNYSVLLRVTDQWGRTHTVSTYANIVVQPPVDDEEEDNNWIYGLGIAIVLAAIAVILLRKQPKNK